MQFSKGTGTILCIAALSYLPTASAVTINLSERSLLQRPSSNSLANFANVTSLSEYPSPHFAAQLGFGDVRLRSTSLLMNAVEALATLALKDQTAGSSGSHFQADRYSDVVIDVEPQHPATDVLNEVALLCISYGIGHVIRRREYKNAEITCFWDAVVVALVHFERPGYQSSSNTTEALFGNKNSSSLITTPTPLSSEPSTPS